MNDPQQLLNFATEFDQNKVNLLQQVVLLMYKGTNADVFSIPSQHLI